MEEEKRDHEAKMKKMESEMEQVFEMKVREKKQKLKDSEADVSSYRWFCIIDKRVPNHDGRSVFLLAIIPLLLHTSLSSGLIQDD
jgi:hypothetical protein